MKTTLLKTLNYFQSALLKLREKALKEKTKAELAWLEQQKQHTRDKGADDVYPQLKKRKRGLLLRLQQEQVYSTYYDRFFCWFDVF